MSEPKIPPPTAEDMALDLAGEYAFLDAYVKAFVDRRRPSEHRAALAFMRRLAAAEARVRELLDIIREMHTKDGHFALFDLNPRIARLYKILAETDGPLADSIEGGPCHGCAHPPPGA